MPRGRKSLIRSDGEIPGRKSETALLNRAQGESEIRPGLFQLCIGMGSGLEDSKMMLKTPTIWGAFINSPCPQRSSGTP